MPDCDYCDASFSDESMYLSHLAEDHRDELGRIDGKRVENHLDDSDESSGGRPYVVYGIGLVCALVVLGLVALVVSEGLSDEDAVHEHGYLDLEIDGETYDFDKPAYWYEERTGEMPTFHFHRDDAQLRDEGNIWHVHPERVDVREAMADVDKPVTDTSIEVGDETYDDDDPDTSVEFLANDEPIGPDYELRDGDRIRIVVETGE